MTTNDRKADDVFPPDGNPRTQHQTRPGNGAPGTGNRHGGGSTDVHAPYNFVPLANEVYIPSWSASVSHDWPFEDGLSGVLRLRLIAESPLLVGGKQVKASKDSPGRVTPFRLPGGRHAVPGSSIKGLLRAVVEIAGFGRMRMLDERRPALRDISKGETIYSRKVRNRVRTGFLRLRRRDGKIVIEIEPCSMVKVEHEKIKSLLKGWNPLKLESVREKYQGADDANGPRPPTGGWRVEGVRFNIHPDRGASSLTYDTATSREEEGTLVFTGQTGKKRREFIFYGRKKSATFVVPDRSWRDFLAVHGDDRPEGVGMSWPDYWRKKFYSGEEIPVFYLKDTSAGGQTSLLRIGLAYMPKLAGDFTTHDLVRHVHPRHLECPGVGNGYDLADLLFGAVNDERDASAQADALRGRVMCGLFVSDRGPDSMPRKTHTTVLNGPKPSYFPSYLCQPHANVHKWKVDDVGKYATYFSTSKVRFPVLRGRKRYPARPGGAVEADPPNDENRDNKSVQVELETLGEGATFTGEIVFHNLKKAELGALLWAIGWGGKKGLRHGLGMGKPFGFGQVRFEILEKESRVAPNDPAAPEASFESHMRDCLESFRTEMGAFCQAKFGMRWEETPAMLNLLAMADPSRAEAPIASQGKKSLGYMELRAKKKINEFNDAKKQGGVLPDYAVLTGALEADKYSHTRCAATRSGPGIAAGFGPTPAAPAVGRWTAPPAAEMAIWESATLKYDPSSGKVEALQDGLRTRPVRLDDLRARGITEEQVRRLRDKKTLAGIRIRVKALSPRNYEIEEVLAPSAS